MDEFLKQLLNSIFAFFKQARSFVQFTIGIAFFVFFWFLNDSTDFIRNYRVSNKIENIEKLEDIIQSQKIDTTTRKMIQEMEYRIIHRESVLERFWLFFFDDKSDHLPQIKVINKAGIEQTAITNNISLNTFGISYKFNFFIHVFSSAWIGILIFLYSLFWIFKERKNSIKIPLIIMGMSIFNIILFSIITYLFPKSELQILNYLVNALFYTVFQLIFLIILLPKIIQSQESMINELDKINQI